MTAFDTRWRTTECAGRSCRRRPAMTAFDTNSRRESKQRQLVPEADINDRPRHGLDASDGARLDGAEAAGDDR